MDKSASCICCSGRPFGDCCEPLLSGRDRARTPRQLMRSRYAAYALGGYGDYLRETWHPSSPNHPGLADLEGADHAWQRLDILQSDQKGNSGVVEFRAVWLDDDGTEQVHHEHSLFLRVKGRWYYLKGEFPDE